MFVSRPTQDQLLIDWTTTINETPPPSDSTSPDNTSLDGNSSGKYSRCMLDTCVSLETCHKDDKYFCGYFMSFWTLFYDHQIGDCQLEEIKNEFTSCTGGICTILPVYSCN